MPLADIAFHRGCNLCPNPVSPTDADAARRIADEVDYHLTASKYLPTDAVGRWIAVRLSDGGSDHMLYDTKEQAVHFAPKGLAVVPRNCLYIEVPLTGMPPSEALHLMCLFRQPWLDTTAPIDAVNPYAHHPLTLPRGVRLS